MSDVVDKKTRSRMMANIRNSNTKPEIFVRSRLHRDGFRFRVHDKKLKGKPDIVLKKYSAIVFVNGCFWHGHDCVFFKWPKTQQAFWHDKIFGNRKRDAEVITSLLADGWRICIVWECAIRLEKNTLVIKQLEKWLTGNHKYLEIRS